MRDNIVSGYPLLLTSQGSPAMWKEVKTSYSDKKETYQDLSCSVNDVCVTVGSLNNNTPLLAVSYHQS